MPTTHNDGRTVDPQLFVDVQDELADRFGGASLTPNSIRGVWVQSGTRYVDDLLRMSVDVADAEENRAFFIAYRRTLENRFDQIVIYVRSYPVDIL